MCQVTTARILESDGKKAIAKFKDKKIELNVELVQGLKSGDYVIFAGGVAIEKIEKEDVSIVCGPNESER
ncbi:MAG: HypC/HybG/HupF family hydrogenase formation chaperone [Candidatus Aenigmatarchaeota archaeon]